MVMPQCCYLAKGAKRPSHSTNTIKFDSTPFDPCNSIKRFDFCPFDQKNSTYLQPPGEKYLKYFERFAAGAKNQAKTEQFDLKTFDPFSISLFVPTKIRSKDTPPNVTQLPGSGSFWKFKISGDHITVEVLSSNLKLRPGIEFSL